jgi:hypothetical protein
MLPKSFLLAFGLFIISCCTHAQNLFFKFTDGTSATYTVDEVRKFTFTGNEMVLLKKDDTTVSWNASTIGNYRFDSTTSITGAELFTFCLASTTHRQKFSLYL